MKKLPFGAAIAVLFFHTAAFAQQPAPARPAQPAPAPAPSTSPPAPSPPPPSPYGAPQPYPPQPYPPQPYPAQPYPPQPYPPQPYPPQAPQPYPPPPPQGPPPPQAPEPPSAPPAYPYGPPPGYRPPAPYYYYPPPAAHRGFYRPFSISAGLGGGALSMPGTPKRESEGGYSYLMRIGFGLAPDFQVFLGIDGMGVSEPSVDLTVTNYLIGAQYFVLPRLYLRGGIGIASVTEDDGFVTSSAAGQAFLGGIGVELAQGDNVSFGVEFTSSASRFSAGTYFANGLTFALSFY